MGASLPGLASRGSDVSGPPESIGDVPPEPPVAPPEPPVPTPEPALPPALVVPLPPLPEVVCSVLDVVGPPPPDEPVVARVPPVVSCEDESEQAMPAVKVIPKRTVPRILCMGDSSR
jgi:hypothetical protein